MERSKIGLIFGTGGSKIDIFSLPCFSRYARAPVVEGNNEAGNAIRGFYL